MCGRITQIRGRIDYVRELGMEFDARRWIGGDLICQYNIYPTSRITVIDRLDDGELSSHVIAWGYRSPWAKDQGYAPNPNAKVEKAVTGQYYRHMWKRGRVLVPADGWYEWTGQKPNKQPWYIRLQSDRPMFMAGITNFRPGENQTVEVGVAIVTENADQGLVDVHDRRPVVFAPGDAQRWIDPELTPADSVELAQLRSRPADDFTWHKVSRAVNVPVSMSELSHAQAAALIEPTD